MKETRTINLNGIVFNIDNDAYLALSSYLHDIEMRLPTDDRKDVMTDIEARIAELFQSAQFARKVQVVDIDMVNQIETRIGKPSDFGENKRPRVKNRPADNQGCARSLGIALKVLLVLMALPLLGMIAGTVCIVVFSLLMAGIGVSAGLTTALPALMGIELFHGSGWLMALFVVCAIAVVVLPIVMVIHSVVAFARYHRGPTGRFWWVSVTSWVLALVVTIVMLCTGVRMDGKPANIRQWLDLTETAFDDEELPATATALALPAFEQIEVNCPAKIRLTQASTQHVALRSSQPENVVAEVRNGVLYVAYKPQKNRYTVSELTIALPTLKAVRANGAAKIETDGMLRQERLEMELSGDSQADLNVQTTALHIRALGASQIELKGTTDSLNIDLTGASQLESDELIAQDVHIVLSGASQADLHAAKTLWAQAAGASQINYKGRPHVIQELSVGASQIKQHD